MYKFLAFVFLLVTPQLVFAAEDSPIKAQMEAESGYPLGVIQADLLKFGYSGGERFRYKVSWTGGIKIGELHLDITRIDEVADAFQIRVYVTTKGGAIHLFYPIRDLHVTMVRGTDRLPYHYEIWQKEGYSYEAHRELFFDQQKWTVRYMKNNKLDGLFQLDGQTNNEFSAFFNSRLMDFQIDQPFVVPTFADNRRALVAVHPIRKELLEDTIVGDVSTMAIMPIMKFEGLYEKKGDTVIWYTDDECRVPVKITSKISIGSLTAVLTGYENHACERYASVMKKW
jgi:hypothetical protein